MQLPFYPRYLATSISFATARSTGAIAIELDVRGADLPLETVKLPETQRLRCGRAPLLRA